MPSASALFTSLLQASALTIASSYVIKRQSTGSGSCTDVHMFFARGWNEGYPGRHQKLRDAVCGSVSSCDYEDIVFDSSNSNGLGNAVEEGRSNGVDQLRAYAIKCPDSKLVVSGYSMGALVVGDMLADSGLSVSSTPGSNVCAALLWGDVAHVGGQSYNVESGSQYSSQTPRSGSSLANLNTFSAVLRSYCQDLDGVCAYGDGTRDYDTDTYHTNYFDVFSGDAASWIVSKCAPDSTTPTPSPSPGDGDTCIAGTVASGLSDNYSGLCSFSCHYGYCPDRVCTCTETGAAIDPPATTGTEGCPAAGLDDSYKGLCSFSCNHGYCPPGACQTC